MLANGGVMVTRARLKDDGTVVEVLRDGSERPLAHEIDWARIDATTEKGIAAQIAAGDAKRCAMPPPGQQLSAGQGPALIGGARRRFPPSATLSKHG
jgi:hypothetical protein